MAPGKCWSARFQIQMAPSPMNTLIVAHSQPLRQALRIDAEAELLGGFDGSHVGGGVRIADGPAFLVHSGLGEHTAELALAGAGALSLDPARPSLGFGGYDRNLDTV